MAIRTLATFTAGVAVGWAGRSVFGSGRELLVRGVVVLHDVRDRAKRFAAEHAEWVEDTFAEGRARYAERHTSVPVDEEAYAHVEGAPRRGRAA